MHDKFANHLQNNYISKINFRDRISFILNHYSYNQKEIIRIDYITRTIIIIIEKYYLNNSPIFVKYNIFKEELESTICIMSGNIKLKIIIEINDSIDELEEEENNENSINLTNNQ